MLFTQLALMLLCTAYCLFYSYQRREKITCMTGMMIAMITAMISSLYTGLILGVSYQPDLELPTIIAVILGMVVGYVTGKPVSLMAAMDGMAAGIMGGMMGGMLGAMLLDPGWMVWFMDFIYILMLIMVFLLIREEEKSYEQWKSQQQNTAITKPNGELRMKIKWLWLAGAILLAAVLVVGYQLTTAHQDTNHQHHHQNENG